jgi:hypothetical protein
MEYRDVLDLLIPIENYLEITIINIFVHFNKSNYINKCVKPYAIILKYIDADTTNTIKLTLEDISGILGHVPLIHTRTDIGPANYNYLDMSTRSHITADSVIDACKELESISICWEHGVTTISSEVINLFKSKLTELQLEYTETDDYIYCDNIHFVKRTCNSNSLKNVVLLASNTYDNFQSIGIFTKYNNEYTDCPSENICLTCKCDNCGKYNIVNYNNIYNTCSCGALLYYTQ